jgi:TonB family protein
LAIKVDKSGKVKVLQAWGPNAPCSNLSDGRVKKIRDAVIEAASKVVFEPPMTDGKPTETEMAITYSFDSTGKPARSKDSSEAKGRIVEAGVLMGRVKHMARPDYPSSARANRLAGAIPVSVLVDVDGKVIAASALGGHKLLQQPAVDAACRSSIEPVQLSGQPVQVSGVITFTFVA